MFSDFQHCIRQNSQNLSKTGLFSSRKGKDMHIEDDPKKPTFEVGDKVMLIQDSDTVWVVTKVHKESSGAKYDIRPDAPKPLKSVPQDELTTPV